MPTLLVIMRALYLLQMLALVWLLGMGKTSNAFAGEDLGAGYRITAINELVDGNGIVAHMKLIRGSEIYGPDLTDLRLTARYEEGGRVRVHITDAQQPRWELPQVLIPRAPVDNLRTGAGTNTHLVGGKSYGLAREGGLAAAHPLRITWTIEPFGFAVVRKSTGEVLFDSAPPSAPADAAAAAPFNSLIFKDQYLEISSRLPRDSFLYGLGESTRPDGMRLRHGRTYTLWATDIGSWNVDIPLYSTYPFLLDMRAGGRAHGLLFLNSNGMDVEYEHEAITFKAIGGVFDFYFFAGPSPLAVVDQYTQLVGRPAAMPYWSFGFHQSRYGYKNIDEMEAVLEKYDAISFPVEAMWSDIDHMDGYKDFTLHPVNYPEDKTRAFVNRLHRNGQKFIMILDPGIKIDETYKTYTRGRALDVFLRNGMSDAYYIAQVWPGFTHIPDFLHPNAVRWWTTEVQEFHKTVPFDGLWLDMNEPANFCSGPNCYVDPAIPCTVIDQCCMVCDNCEERLSRWDNPPYKINSFGTKRPLYMNTVAMNARHHDGERMYNTHNIYGMAEGLATYKALKEMSGNKRPFVLARSCFVGSGAHAAHWTGDNGATWSDLKYSVASILNSGLFGVPMVGADICGFYFETNEELCRRWSQVGAFYPFARSHSDIHTGPQEVYLWTSVAETASHVFRWRYRLLPFFYTLMYEAHTTGAPLARPLFFEYPDDEATWGVDEQFLLGSALLVSPALDAGATSVRAYFPKGIWYNLFDPAHMVRAVDRGVWEDLPAPADAINVHVRQGSIVPMQGFAMTTAAARRTPFALLVAFAPASDFAEFCAAPYSIVCQGSDREYAAGHLYLDDDEAQVAMEVRPGSGRATHVKLEAIRMDGHYILRSSVTEGEFASRRGLVLETVTVLGVQSQPYSVRVNGRLASVPVTVNTAASRMELSGLHLPVGQDFEVVWKTMPSGSGSHSS